jgi:hypothetical protein
MDEVSGVDWSYYTLPVSDHIHEKLYKILEMGLFPSTLCVFGMTQSNLAMKIRTECCYRGVGT